MTTSGRNAVFLEEMGVGPLWVRRLPPSQSSSDAEESAAADAPTAAVDESGYSSSAWDTSGRHAADGAMPLASSASSAGEIAAMDWAQLKSAVASCTKCDLCGTRKRTVFGVGDEKAKWLFIGEGPGRSEDLQGEPFVGPAGKLLDNMLLAMGLKRGENTYIANIVKCRPTDANGRDRPPAPEEAAACLPYLERQIALIKPDIIVTLGKTAALSMLNLDPDTSVSSLRGRVHRYANLPLVVTYHPAYLLRTPADKKKSWADLCLAMKTYGASP